MEGITYIEHFIADPDQLYNALLEEVDWDERMSARKTASFGEAYNYSQMHYPYQEFLPVLAEINEAILRDIGFKPNNCLINFYQDGQSKMGFHSDQTDILERETGVVIVSVGETRILRFRSIENNEVRKDYELPSGSLIYMTQEVQHKWQHAIPRANTVNGRMSLTFRRMK